MQKTNISGNRSHRVVAALTLLALASATTSANAEAFKPADGYATSRSGTVESIGGSETPYATGNQLELAADYCLQNRNYDQAIGLCKRALAADDNDLDIHKSYAEALEGKWKGERSKDTDLFNACLREWLIVLRTERGPEKLPSFHGLQIPGYGHLYRDEDYEMAARVHLSQLTGRAPKAWETDTQYLKRAGEGTASTVTGKLLPSPAEIPQRAEAKAASRTVEQNDPLDWINH